MSTARALLRLATSHDWHVIEAFYLSLILIISLSKNLATYMQACKFEFNKNPGVLTVYELLEHHTN